MPYRRIIEWPWLEGTPRIIKLQRPCLMQGCQPPRLILDQAVLGPIQPGLECVQGQGIHNLSGQPIPAPHHCLCKEFPPDIQGNNYIFDGSLHSKFHCEAIHVHLLLLLSLLEEKLNQEIDSTEGFRHLSKVV